jgi:hypothetical protein
MEKSYQQIYLPSFQKKKKTKTQNKQKKILKSEKCYSSFCRENNGELTINLASKLQGICCTRFQKVAYVTLV